MKKIIKKLEIPKDIEKELKKDARSSVFQGNVIDVIRTILIKHYRKPHGKYFLSGKGCNE